MLGFSLPKLLVLALIIFAVWQGFKYLQRRQEVQARNHNEKVRNARRETQGSADPVEDMQRCPDCGIFFSGTGPKCGGKVCHSAG